MSGAVLGLTDVDALTLSMARGLPPESLATAGQALAVGVLANTALKITAALLLGAGRFRLLTAIGLASIGAALIVSLLLHP